MKILNVRSSREDIAKFNKRLVMYLIDNEQAVQQHIHNERRTSALPNNAYFLLAGREKIACEHIR